MEREAFLDRVRTSIGIGTIPGGPSADPGGLVPGLPDVDLAERFTAALESVDGTVHTSGAIAAVDEIIALHGVGPILAWDADRIPAPGVLDPFTSAGCEIVDPSTPRDAVGRREHHRRLLDVRFGLTGAEAAFAESGTIVVRSGRGRPRMASLVPLIHVAVLPAECIFRSQMHWLTQPGVEVSEAANVVYVTGPSRTADIEQQLNLGVHGPRNVHVVIV